MRLRVLKRIFCASALILSLSIVALILVSSSSRPSRLSGGTTASRQLGNIPGAQPQRRDKGEDSRLSQQGHRQPFPDPHQPKEGYLLYPHQDPMPGTTQLFGQRVTRPGGHVVKFPVGRATSPDPDPDLRRLDELLKEMKKKHEHLDGLREKQRALQGKERGAPEMALGGDRMGKVPSHQKEVDQLWDLLMTETRKPEAAAPEKRKASCTPKNHVFFGKIHKTGSSTVANVLQRYGFTRGLNFVLPRKRLHSQSYNYISSPGHPVTLYSLIPPPRGQAYDILWSHALYNSDFYHMVMPKDTFYMAILRHPLQQFQSAFEYYGRVPGSNVYTLLQQNVSNPMALYLQQPWLYEHPAALTSYFRNKQSQDLGMKNAHVANETLRHEYLKILSKDFHFVMITEFFDESLVLLRRLLCWDVKDILYITKNKNVYRKERHFTQQDLNNHRKLNVADYELYELFLRRFNQTLSQQTEDYWQEVRHFKDTLKQVQTHCHFVARPPLIIAASRWSGQFTVDRNDCKMLHKHELIFLDEIMVDAVRRYQMSIRA